MLKIHAISDTHNRHSTFSMPKGADMLICSGDVCSRGSLEEAISFLHWFEVQPYKYKILVPGNHDRVFEINPGLIKEECESRNIILLNDSGVTINGLKIWGSPVQPEFCNWAFNKKRGEEIERHWDLIPIDTDILITHGPPAGILDSTPLGASVGCHDLLKKINKINIKLHIFGHIHWSRGYSKIGNTLFVNAASLNEYYQPVRGVPFRIEMDDTGIFKIKEKKKR